MIQQRPATTDLTRVGPMAAIVLAAGLSVGFIAGQAAPDLFGSLFGPSAALSTSTTLPQNADYGVRHIGITQPLSQADDYGTRHISTTPLTPADDYGNRHP